MIYDLEKLIEGRESIKANIKALEEALDIERKKLEDYNGHIEASQEILKQHGEDPSKYGGTDEASGQDQG